MNYQKPSILVDADLAEGVYAASGSAEEVTYTADVHPTHTSNHDGPQWRFDVNAERSGSSSSTGQLMTIVFSTPVTVVDKGKAESVSGSGTSTIMLVYRAAKSNGHMSLGNIYVESPIEPVVTSAVCVEYN